MLMLALAPAETSIKHSAAQYGTSKRIVDTFTFDMTVRSSLPLFRASHLFEQ